MPDLDETGGEHNPIRKPAGGLTAITEVALLRLIKFLTSVRIVLAVALCASLNP